MSGPEATPDKLQSEFANLNLYNYDNEQASLKHTKFYTTHDPAIVFNALKEGLKDNTTEI